MEIKLNERQIVALVEEALKITEKETAEVLQPKDIYGKLLTVNLKLIFNKAKTAMMAGYHDGQPLFNIDNTGQESIVL